MCRRRRRWESVEFECKVNGWMLRVCACVCSAETNIQNSPYITHTHTHNSRKPTPTHRSVLRVCSQVGEFELPNNPGPSVRILFVVFWVVTGACNRSVIIIIIIAQRPKLSLSLSLTLLQQQQQQTRNHNTCCVCVCECVMCKSNVRIYIQSCVRVCVKYESVL